MPIIITCIDFNSQCMVFKKRLLKVIRVERSVLEFVTFNFFRLDRLFENLASVMKKKFT